jgi:hypothetical protein
MPPVEPSLRASLLTGASALALSVTNTVAHGQTALPPTPRPPSTWQVWIEGASFSGVGGNFNVPYLPGLGAPYTSFKPQDGFEYAFGVDFAPLAQPYHYVFDFRYGKTGTATGFASTASSSSSSKFVRVPPPSGFFTTIFGTQTNINSNTSTSQVTKKWENHLAADFMVGRELGVGSNKPDLRFGVRVADLRATAQSLMNSQTNTTTNITRTIYSSFVVGGRVTNSTLFSSASSQSFARWNSEFFGAGPRVTITGGVPLAGSWSFEYSGSIAGLIGDRSLALTLVNGNNTGLFCGSIAEQRSCSTPTDSLRSRSHSRKTSRSPPACAPITTTLRSRPTTSIPAGSPISTGSIGGRSCGWPARSETSGSKLTRRA